MLPELFSASSALVPLLADVALKGALILAGALAVVLLMERASAAGRHAVLATAMAAVLALPLLLVALPSWSVPVLPASAPEAPAAAASPSALAPLAAPLDNPATRDVAPAAPEFAAPAISRAPTEGAAITEDGQGAEASGGVLGLLAASGLRLPGAADARAAINSGSGHVLGMLPSSLRDWRVLLLLGWLVGVLLVAGRWAVAYVNARHLLEDAEPVDDPAWHVLAENAAAELGVDRPVRLLRSSRLAVPVAWCFGRPAVVLPADCDEWSDERREVVLLHELAHVARHDGTTQLLAQAAVALHWFNPLAWVGYRRLLREREQACDDLVLATGTRASTYAEHLLQIGRRFRPEPLSLLAVAAMARSAELSDRIEAVLDPRQPRSSMSRTRALLLTAGAAVVMIPLAAFSPTAASGGGVLAGPATEPVPSSSAQADDDWRWQGRAAAGELVEIYALNGAIRVREGRGNVVRVEGTPRGRNARRARLEVNDVRGGVVICVVYEGQRGCEPGTGPSGRARNTRNATVNLEVVVPERVRVKARTTNGAIRTDELRAAVEAYSTNGAINTGSRTGDVRARTTNGAITLTANGRVDAQTTNGAITARLASTNWSGTSRLSTTNGSVTAYLPRGANVQVDARTSTGSIRTDFDEVTVVRRRGPGATASGTIGRGGRQLEIRTTNGGVRIERGSRTSSARPLDSAAPAAPAAAAEARDGAADVAMASVDLARLVEEVTSESLLMAQDVSGLVAGAMAEIDWAGISREVEASLEEVRADRHLIRAEIREALEEVQRELEAARRELRGER